MPSRKFHGKSRHGCKTCKQRKVRCDLGRPVCENCVRLSRECLYADDLTPGVPLDQRSGPSQQAVDNVQPDPTPESIPGTLPVLELELMHQFTASTVYATTDNLTYHLPLWQHVIPKLAFRHHFMLHGILATAALHLRHQCTDPRRAELLAFARHHQQEGLKTYIPLLGNITAENCDALFAFSQMIAAVSFAFLSISDETQSPQAFIREFTGMFKLIMGAAAIAIQARDWLRQGELAPMLGHGPALLDQNFAPLSGEPKAALQALIERIYMLSPKGLTTGSASGVETTRDCYITSIEKLKPLFPRPPEKTPKIGTVIGWPVFVDQAYFDMLTERDDAALVILAYYGVTLHRLSHIWWLDGVGKRLVQSISEIIQEDWAPYLMWANGEVFKDV